jgi:hypothetical protein
MIRGIVIAHRFDLMFYEPLACISGGIRAFTPEILSCVVTFQRPIGAEQNNIARPDMLTVFLKFSGGNPTIFTQVGKIDYGSLSHELVHRDLIDRRCSRQKMEQSINVSESMQVIVHMLVKEEGVFKGMYRI